MKTKIVLALACLTVVAFLEKSSRAVNGLHQLPIKAEVQCCEPAKTTETTKASTANCQNFSNTRKTTKPAPIGIQGSSLNKECKPMNDCQPVEKQDIRFDLPRTHTQPCFADSATRKVPVTEKVKTIVIV